MVLGRLEGLDCGRFSRDDRGRAYLVLLRWGLSDRSISGRLAWVGETDSEPSPPQSP